jgi:hypothetical protein
MSYFQLMSEMRQEEEEAFLEDCLTVANLRRQSAGKPPLDLRDFQDFEYLQSVIAEAKEENRRHNAEAVSLAEKEARRRE